MQSVARTFNDGERIRAIPPDSVTQVMLQLLELKPTDKLLEIGTGSGTQTAILGRACAELHSIELRPFWNIVDSKGQRTYLRSGDGALGIPEEAPFDAIVATCGISKIPPPWRDQLKEGGRLVVPVGTIESQKLTLFVKRKGMLEPERVGAYVRFSMMEERNEKQNEPQGRIQPPDGSYSAE